MKINFKTDGKPENTIIYNADTGEALERVVSVSLEMATDSLPILNITVIPNSISVDMRNIEANLDFCEIERGL